MDESLESKLYRYRFGDWHERMAPPFELSPGGKRAVDFLRGTDDLDLPPDVCVAVRGLFNGQESWRQDAEAGLKRVIARLQELTAPSLVDAELPTRDAEVFEQGRAHGVYEVSMLIGDLLMDTLGEAWAVD